MNTALHNTTPHNSTLHNATLHKPIHMFSPEIIIKLIGVVAAFYGMAIHWEGLFSFTYFTNLSNLVMGCVLLYALVGKILLSCAQQSCDVADSTLHGWRACVRNTLQTQMWYRIKYMATLAISITFLLYLCFLAPTSQSGFIGAYLSHYASSLCTHFIAPLCAIVDFVWFDYRFNMQVSDVFWSLLPPFVYIGYVCVLSLVFGVRWKTVMLAPYNFLNFGAPCGWFGFDLSAANTYTLGIGVFYFVCVFTLIFMLIVLLFLKLIKRRAHHTSQNA